MNERKKAQKPASSMKISGFNQESGAPLAQLAIMRSYSGSASPRSLKDAAKQFGGSVANMKELFAQVKFIEDFSAMLRPDELSEVNTKLRAFSKDSASFQFDPNVACLIFSPVTSKVVPMTPGLAEQVASYINDLAPDHATYEQVVDLSLRFCECTDTNEQYLISIK